MSCSPLALETVWLDKSKFEDAERFYHERSYKLHWMNSSSKMGEPKLDLKEDLLKTEVKESIPIENKKMETIINAQPVEEKAGKEKKKDEKGAKTEKKDVGSDEAKADKGKKKNKEDDAKDKDKEKQTKKKQPKEAKKSKEEKPSDDNKKNAVAAPQGNSLDDVKSKDETSSEGADKKGNKKSKKTKNKKNQQAAGDEGSIESTNKKHEKKETGTEQTQKKKPDKKESKKVNQHCLTRKSTIADEIASARQYVKNAIECCDGGGAADSEILARLMKLETENKKLKSLADDLKKVTSTVNQLTSRLNALEKGVKAPLNSNTSQQPKVEEKSKKKDDDDDVDLFGSDEEEDAEMLKIKAERLKQYEEKKAKKPGVIAKSNIILDVKPWDDETNMKSMEEKVRQVACDGLLWGASKLVPLAYGIHKLQISCVIEDEKISVDWLQEQIEANEDLVQSVDIAAFNKV